ncbi:hypothetical protein [Burkholderia sp. BCC0322]|uniref:hypothetical protein n=1 Tax=Burkholderia sp. BCC0322 TaxID=2676296 RepID=UPI00158CB5C2|nr:hypothetical protein [Burkholderia sp. BCC0322]
MPASTPARVSVIVVSRDGRAGRSAGDIRNMKDPRGFCLARLNEIERAGRLFERKTLETRHLQRALSESLGIRL